MPRSNTFRLLVASLLPPMLALAACSSSASESEAEGEIHAQKYAPALVTCLNPSSTATINGPNGEVKSLSTTSDHGTSYAELEEWTLLPGFGSTLVRNTAHPITRATSRGTRLTFEGGSLALSDGPTGALEGTLLLGQKATSLECQPVRIFCHSPHTTDRPQITRLALQIARMVDGFAERDVGVTADLTARIPPKGLPTLDVEGTFTMLDSKGSLTAAHATASDPTVGDLVIGWDETTKARVGRLLFSKAFAAKYEVSNTPEGGADVVCDLSEIPEDAAEINPPR